jgi:hypothetical protein
VTIRALATLGQAFVARRCGAQAWAPGRFRF